MNSEVMYFRDMGGTMGRSQFSFAEEVAAVARERESRHTAHHVPHINIGECLMRTDIKSDRPRCKRMREHSITDGYRRILVDGQILEVRTNKSGQWGATLGKTGTIRVNAGVWTYIGKGDEECPFFKDGNYLSHYRVAPYVLV